MSLKIYQERVIKVSQEEYDILMLQRNIGFTPTKRGILFLKKTKDEFPFGKCEMLAQNGEPHRIIRAVDDELIILPPVDKLTFVEGIRPALDKKLGM